ncbi:hypothetical protein FA15DRAFT_587163 [Coprinopsis marcescibilis]|uniref:HIT-type domain-containing protein n=1 Tax=Coprinopsis marcescibilis TaxID=230819 RepID=A0A5C3L2T2_COPMA|nr:hypothetical protein FA15DRAFT_587163 [Coprinopsis marcescibilis]
MVVPAEVNIASSSLSSQPNFPEGSSTATSPPDSKPPPPCSLCTQTTVPKPAKYTCPRCGAKSCSVACSKLHKQQTGCSGERDKVAYVPMKEYGWGTMMNDYAFLEDVGRKVGEVGREIVSGGFLHGGVGAGMGVGVNGGYNSRNGDGGRGGRGGMARGRGGVGGARGRPGPGRTKRDIFKMQMEVRDVDVDLLPLGMKRRSANQSGWDSRNQMALLTIEFKFHRPRDPLAPSSDVQEPPLVFLTHRNKTNTPLLKIIQALVKERIISASSSTKKGAQNEESSRSLEWLKSMVLPSAEDPEGYCPPRCVMKAPTDPSLILQSIKKQNSESDRQYATGLGKALAEKMVTLPATMKTLKNAQQKKIPTSLFNIPKVYYNLDLNVTLGEALRYTQFVEFPTIEVAEDGDEILASGVLVDPRKHREGGAEGRGLDVDEVVEPLPKRRKLDPKAGKERIKGLLGGYGSESDRDGSSHSQTEGEQHQEEEASKEKPKLLSLVADYAASDEDEQMDDATKVLDKSLPSGADGRGSQSDEEDEELDAAALLELVRQVKGEQWAVEQDRVDDDALDWEGSDADAEGESDDGDY